LFLNEQVFSIYNISFDLNTSYYLKNRDVLSMKILVAYSSRTGNTKKIAEAIYGEIQENKVINEIDSLNNLEGYDIIFLGFPIETFGPSQKVKDFMKNHSKNKKIALFITHGSPEFSDFLTNWIEESKKCLDDSSEILGVFNCQGEVAQFVIDHMIKSEDPTLQYFAKESPKSKGQPDETRIKKAKEFSREIIKKCSF